MGWRHPEVRQSTLSNLRPLTISRYDNCYATSKTNMVDATSAEAKSPNRFIKMAAAINETDRDIKYFLCQWGIGEDVPQW